MEKLDEDFGCKPMREDVDNIISERCWRENHRGDSRKWLTRDDQKKIPAHRIYSTMKATYTPLVGDDFQYIGKRRSLLIKECYEKSYEEVMNDREKPPPVAEYCTEYDGNYYLSNFDPEEKPFEKDAEMFHKYPLYGSSAVSFWLHKLEHRREEVPPSKCTKITDSKNPFKRNSTFSTPITESLHCTEW